VLSAVPTTALAAIRARRTGFGLAERLRAEIRHTLDAPMRPLVEAALERVCTELDEAAFAATCARGQGLSLDDGFVRVLGC